MTPTIRNRFDNWELSLLVFKDSGIVKYKVTRRFPDLSVAETKIFNSMDEARIQLDEWMN